MGGFGSLQGPRAPRAKVDFLLDSEQGVVPAGELPRPMGASAFADPKVNERPVGHYHRLGKGTPLPEGISVVRDDAEAVPGSDRPPTHHTFYAEAPMPYAEFVQKFLGLPWQYVEKKKDKA